MIKQKTKNSTLRPEVYFGDISELFLSESLSTAWESNCQRRLLLSFLSIFNQVSIGSTAAYQTDIAKWVVCNTFDAVHCGVNLNSNLFQERIVGSMTFSRIRNLLEFNLQGAVALRVSKF